MTEAWVAEWDAAGLWPDSRPPSMLQPCTFDDSTDDRLKVVRMRPVDESEDTW
jgi:hypothetical protein